MYFSLYPDFINESTTDIDINAIFNNKTINKNSINNNASIQDNFIKRLISFEYNNMHVIKVSNCFT